MGNETFAFLQVQNHGFNKLVGSDTEKLKGAYEFFRTKSSDFSMNLYGRGVAAEMAVKQILEL